MENFFSVYFLKPKIKFGLLFFFCWDTFSIWKAMSFCLCFEKNRFFFLLLYIFNHQTTLKKIVVTIKCLNSFIDFILVYMRRTRFKCHGGAYWDDIFLFSSTLVLKKRFIFNFVLNPPADIQFRTFAVFYFLIFFLFSIQTK